MLGRWKSYYYGGSSTNNDKTVNLKSLATSNYGADVDVINEDGELVQAFEAQKRITKQLEEELRVERQRHGDTVTELAGECERLCEDNERQHKLLTLGGAGGDQFMQQEVARLAAHNLSLQERLEALRERCDALEERCEGYRRRLLGLNLTLEDGTDAIAKDTSSIIVSKDRDTSLLPVVKKKDRDFMGMFEYKAGTENIIVQRLVSELSPRTAVTLLPGLPAYVLFMCIRYTDYVNDDDKVRVLLRVFINGVKKVVKRKGDKMDVSILWLANTLRLLHCLKQYSGDRNYQAENTPAQNEQCLRNFDLSEYRQVLSDIAVWIYQGLITSLEQQLQQLIVPALLEYEEISGVSGRAPRGRAPSQDGPPPPSPLPPRSPQHLTKELAQIRSSLYYHGVDPDLIVQIFRQLYYFVCASCLNQLLLRKDLCRWSKGMQIRYNLSSLEVWAKEQLPADSASVLATLQPIIQAVYLMQARKSAADVQSTCDMCPDLTSMQICKILNLYTPAEEFEPKITPDFIRQIQTCLQTRDKERQHSDHMNLLMDSKFNFPVKFPFSPSTIRLEHVELAEALNLVTLLTKL